MTNVCSTPTKKLFNFELYNSVSIKNSYVIDNDIRRLLKKVIIEQNLFIILTITNKYF
jgi:hypothetical protein